MKTILAVLVTLSLASAASAQKFGGYHPVYRSPRVVVVPRVSYGVGLGFGYPYFGYPYYGYAPYGYPYGYRSAYGSNNAKLSLEIQSIKLDYKKQIRDARHDKSVSHSERRAEIRNLKQERDQAILSAQRNFYNRRTNRYNNLNTQPNPNNNGSDNKDDSINPGSTQNG